MTSIFVNRSFLFKFVNLIVVSPTFMQKNKIQIFNIINDQWNAFFSRIHINYLRENLIVLKNVLLSFRVIKHIVRFEICYYYQCFIKSNMWLSRRISLSIPLENIRKPEVFRGYRKRPVAWNRLTPAIFWGGNKTQYIWLIHG